MVGVVVTHSLPSILLRLASSNIVSYVGYLPRYRWDLEFCRFLHLILHFSAFKFLTFFGFYLYPCEYDQVKRKDVGSDAPAFWGGGNQGSEISKV